MKEAVYTKTYSNQSDQEIRLETFKSSSEKSENVSPIISDINCDLMYVFPLQMSR